MNVGGTELANLVGENADIAAGIEHSLACIVDLASEQFLKPLPPRATDACSLNCRGKGKGGDQSHRDRLWADRVPRLRPPRRSDRSGGTRARMAFRRP